MKNSRVRSTSFELVLEFPKRDCFLVELLGVHFGFQKGVDVDRTGRRHPNRIPKCGWVRHARQRALKLEFEAHVVHGNRQTVGEAFEALMQTGGNEPRVKPRRRQRLERIVAREKLIAAIATERDRHKPAGE